MPVLATYFSIRRGRDPFFKFFMRTLFPRTVKEYEKKFGIKFIGWYNVAHGWDFDNVIMFDLPDYGTLDKLEADESSRALGHRAGNRFTHSPELLKQSRIHAEEIHFGLVRVGDKTLIKNSRRTGRIGDAAGEEPARAGFRGAEGKVFSGEAGHNTRLNPLPV